MILSKDIMIDYGNRFSIKPGVLFSKLNYELAFIHLGRGKYPAQRYVKYRGKIHYNKQLARIKRNKIIWNS